MAAPPRSAYGNFSTCYYGTDDGFPELRPREEAKHDAAHVAGLYKVYSRYENFHRGLASKRTDNIHLVSVVGGLYGLNLIPLFRPTEITFFDLNPNQICLFNIVRRVWILSSSSDEFLTRLANADYEVDGEQELEIQACFKARQNGTLAEKQGGAARSLLSSWRYALDHFELTRQLLMEVPIKTHIWDMQSPEFKDFVANNENLWIFCSNVLLFAFFELRFKHPQNAAVFASYFEKVEILDLATTGQGEAVAHCRLPMSAEGRLETPVR